MSTLLSFFLLLSGYCFQYAENHPLLSGRAPYCLHAYAVTVQGAKKLLELVDACGAFADAQVGTMILKHILYRYSCPSVEVNYSLCEGGNIL